jgi:hypothetical protein
LYDTDDVCAKYNQDYSHTSCQNGYSAGYDYKLKWTDIEKAYKQGFEAGTKNLDEAGACLMQS